MMNMDKTFPSVYKTPEDRKPTTRFRQEGPAMTTRAAGTDAPHTRRNTVRIAIHADRYSELANS